MMKAWLRAAMAALLVGGVVYLVWEERYKKILRIVTTPVQNDTIDKLQAAIDRTKKTIEAVKALDEKENAFEKLEEAMQQHNEKLDRLFNEHDMTMVALGHPELASDPLSAEFRLAIEEKRRRSE
jgi:hypothetical protein